MSSAGDTAPAILLSPRPLARVAARFLLLPLLPSRPTPTPLPSEIWSKILAHVFDDYIHAPPAERNNLKLRLLVVCKNLKTIALPLFYQRVCASSLASLQRFAAHIHSSDQKWDSIRRIPYSTPGRWVQALDLRELDITSQHETYLLDAALTGLFPLLPFLAHLMVSPTITLSRRAATSLSCRPESSNIRALKGLRISTSYDVNEDHFVDLIRACNCLEELSIVGSGIDTIDPGSQTDRHPVSSFKPLHLPLLKRVIILSMACSPLMHALVCSPLPSMQHLTITPYDESLISASLVPQFIRVHGRSLVSLHFFTPKTWPVVFSPSPRDVLETCSGLYHLSLENPLPVIGTPSTDFTHPLRILSIPRPRPAEFLVDLEALLPKLPSLSTVRMRDVRWLRPGMSSRAQQAGVQGEMIDWRRRLARRGVQVVDSNWKSGPDS